jgi:hypothetical protein
LVLREPFGMTTRSELLHKCHDGLGAGMDFPTLWNEVLRPDPMVIGPPVQTVRDGRIRLEVRLIGGAAIAFDTDTLAILPE